MFTTVTLSFACLCPRQTGDCTCIETVTGKLVIGGLVTDSILQETLGKEGIRLNTRENTDETPQTANNEFT